MDILKAKKSWYRRKRLLAFAVMVLLGAVLVSISWYHGERIAQDLIKDGHQTQDALLSAERLLLSGEFLEAERAFSKAQAHLGQARSRLGSVGNALASWLQGFPFSSPLSSGAALLSAAEHLARAGEGLARGGALFSSISPEHFFGDARASSGLRKLLQATAIFNASERELASAFEALSRVNAAHVPEAFREDFVRFRDRAESLKNALSALEDFGEIVDEITGRDGPRKYLLLFQNSSELRATGGFIGSYGLLELSEGEVKKFAVGDIYDIDWQISRNIIPPKPIQEISTGWSTHDANWFLDFPTSAKKISEMYEKTGGATPDGVIALTPKVMERILKITGPVTLERYGITVTFENFVDVTQEEVEFNYDRLLNKPKQFLVDLAPILFERFKDLSPQDRIALAQAFLEGLEEKDIMIFLRDEKEQQLILRRGWAGEIRDSDRDYLAVVHSNINGFKTDRVIAETITHETKVQWDGSLVDTVTIERAHRGGPALLPFYNKVNKDYLRIYVPKGTKLLSASGFTPLPLTKTPFDYTQANFYPDPLIVEIERNLTHDVEARLDIFSETERTVFGGWVFLSPGETARASVSYRLPFRIDLTQSSAETGLLVQKQPGTEAFFLHRLQFPEGWERVWAHPPGIGEQQEELARDLLFASIFEQR